MASNKKSRRTLTIILSGLAILIVAALVAGSTITAAKTTIKPGTPIDLGTSLTGTFRDPVYTTPGRLIAPVDSTERYSLFDQIFGTSKPNGSIDVKPQIATASRTTTQALLTESAKRGVATATQGVAGVTVQATVPNGPAEKAGLKIDDAIIGANGKPVRNVDDLLAILNSVPSKTLDLEIVRGTSDMHVTITADATGKLGMTAGTSKQLGFGGGNYQLANTDEELSRATGLILTLAFMDSYGPGDLTGGARLAAIGEIGTKGEILKAVDLKPLVASLNGTGIKNLLVPTSQVTAAKKLVSSKVNVVGVKTFNEALFWLCTHGGKDVRCQSGLATS